MPHTAQHNLLHQAFLQNRLSHAYLLSGVAGLGKTDFARQFSKLLLCATGSTRAASASACDECKSCKQFSANTHPDFILIEPTEKSHSIKIDQIRALSQQLFQTAHRGNYKIVIISPADAMPISAANALLKTLEEPTGRVIIFLIDNQQHSLPATIASRCQKIYFHRDAIKAITKNHDTVLCKQLIKHLTQLSDHQVNPIAPVINWIKQDLATILDILVLFCADISRLQFHASENNLIQPENRETFVSLSKKISPIQLQQFIEFILEKKSMVSKGINLNTQLCLENIFIEFSRYFIC